MISIERRDFVKGAAAAAGIAALSSTATALADAAGYIPGTYTGTSEAVGTVTVTMTFDEAAITDVSIDVSGETNFLGAQIGTALEATILEAQSADVDAIAGCTMTSTAIKRAARSCIAQAMGEDAVVIPSYDTATDTDWLGAEPQIDESLVTETWDADVVIVGAGNGGCVAGAYAAANGVNAILIEQNAMTQDARGWYGCVDSSLQQENGIATDRKKLLSEISRYASGKCNQRVVKTWINESGAMHSFIDSMLGVDGTCTLTFGEAAHWPESCSEENTTYFFPEMEHCWDNGRARNRLMVQTMVDNGGQAYFNTALVKLEKDGERVCGLIAQNRDDGHLIRINAAKGVILACGGYAGNPFMMEALDPLAVKTTTAASCSPFNRGMGIRAAIWAGANFDDEAAPMLFDRGLVAPGIDAGYAVNENAFGGREFPATMKQYGPGTQPFLKVNRKGERFANESSPYNDINYAAAHQPGGVYAQICDANFYEDVLRFHTIGCSAQAQVEGMMQSSLDTYEEQGLIMKADTLDELADKLGFEGDAKETFLATCERYNELFDAQDDEDFGKPSCRLSELRTAPFYGGWLGASLLTTEQGISINENTQALDADCNPIEGLCVIGDNSGSFFANNYPCLMPGVAVGRTMTFAIKAVKFLGNLE